MIATPRAKLEVVTTPMAASAPTHRRWLIRMNQKAGEQRPQPAADKKIDVHHIAENRAAENGVGKTVADVAHAAQDDVDADKAAERADDHRRDEAVTKKLVLERE